MSRRKYRILSGLITVALLLGSCSGRKPSTYLTIEDADALRRIYESSSIALANVSTHIQVKGGGAIEIDVEGDASPSRPDEKRGGTDEVTEMQERSKEPLWIPILLTKKLPPYFEVMGRSAGRTPEIEAYQFSGGLWCIAEVIDQEFLGNESSSPQNHSQRDTQVPTMGLSGHLALRAQLYSDSFATSLPVLIPIGQSGSTTAVSVTLPEGSRFESSEILGIAGEESHRARGYEGNQRGRQSQLLTVLPSSISGASVQAGVSIPPSDVAAWDLSTVSFRLPSTHWPFRRWFFPTALLFVCLSLALWIRAYLVASLDRELLNISSSASLGLLITQSTSKADSVEAERLNRLLPAAMQLLPLIAKTTPRGYARPRGMFEYLYLRWVSDIAPSERHEFKHYVEKVEELVFKRFRLELLLWTIAVICLALAIWLLAIVAHAQRGQPVVPLVVPKATLADTNVSICGQDLSSPDSDRVKVAVDFFPLTADKAIGVDSEIDIGTAPDFSIDYVSPPGDREPLQLGGVSRSSAHLKARARFSPAVRRLLVIGNQNKSFVPGSAYFKNLTKSDRATFAYSIQEAQRYHERANGDLNWLYLFPFDTIDVVAPLRFGQPVLLSRLEFRQQIDFLGSPKLTVGQAGGDPPISLTLNNDATKYQMALNTEQRFLLPSNTNAVLTASFKRSPLQRYGLTLGPLLGALGVGILIGWLMSLSDSAAAQILTGAIGIVGLPMAIRAAVFEHYKDLPNGLTFRAITLFEAIFLLSLAVLAVVAFLVRAHCIKNS